MDFFRRQVARFSFSFFLVAFLLGWESHRRLQDWGLDAKVVAELLGAGICAGLGLWGVRLRHRPR